MEQDPQEPGYTIKDGRYEEKLFNTGLYGTLDELEGVRFVFPSAFLDKARWFSTYKQQDTVDRMAEVTEEYEKYDLEKEVIIEPNETIVDAEATVVIEPSDGVLTIAEL